MCGILNGSLHYTMFSLNTVSVRKRWHCVHICISKDHYYSSDSVKLLDGMARTLALAHSKV